MSKFDDWVDKRLANLADHAMERLEHNLEARVDALPEQVRELVRAELAEVLSAIDGRIDGVLERVDRVIPDTDALAGRLFDRLKDWRPW